MQVNFILNLLTCFKSNYSHVVNLSLTCFFICSLSVNASEQITIKEQQLKSAFIYNFSRLVNWPEESLAMNNSLFNICLIGEDNFNNALSPLQNRTANNYKISIKRHINLAEISQCQILYISQDRKDQLFQLFQLSKKFHILTISDINNFAELGGHINFIVKNKKLKLKINLNQAKQSNLEISSRILSLAEIVDND